MISGFTVKNANFEGILVANATGVTISGNTVNNNNLGLMVADTTTCPGLPTFETNEDDDCGEGIHLIGVDHSIVSGNRVENNAGGILVSDETGASHDNLITGNSVANNAFDCGITLASHAWRRICRREWTSACLTTRSRAIWSRTTAMPGKAPESAFTPPDRARPTRAMW